MIREDLNKKVNRPTKPDNTTRLTSRVGRISEIVKSMVVWELRNYFNHNSGSDIALVPFIEKFATDLQAKDRDLDPLETVVRIVRSHPDITEKLPYVGVSVSGGQNDKMAFSGKFVDKVMQRPRLTDTRTEYTPGAAWTIPADPNDFLDGNQPGIPVDPNSRGAPANIYLDDGDYVDITTTFDGVEYESRFVFTRKLLGRAPQTARTVADIINLQALYCRADVVYVNDVPRLVLEPGGPLGRGKYTSIQKTGESLNFASYITWTGDKKSAPSNEFPAANRYANTWDMTVSLVIGTEGENIRTELADLLMDYFTFVLADRQFTLWGRSFTSNIPDEQYQILIIDKGVGLTGEQEVPRPDDPSKKVYINRLNIPVKVIQYIDRAVQMGAVAENSEDLPDMN